MKLKYTERWGINDHEVKCNIEFRPLSECYVLGTASAATAPALTSASLYVDYIYLDTDERRQFAQVAHISMCGKVTALNYADTSLSKSVSILQLAY